ncbi:MAG: hypothetical protein F6K39_46185 [Okeania sp. SIO3B3]|nr:hypothetical protein [Okeania sp. SIO3B3]
MISYNQDLRTTTTSSRGERRMISYNQDLRTTTTSSRGERPFAPTDGV